MLLMCSPRLMAMAASPQADPMANSAQSPYSAIFLMGTYCIVRGWFRRWRERNEKGLAAARSLTVAARNDGRYKRGSPPVNADTSDNSTSSVPLAECGGSLFRTSDRAHLRDHKRRQGTTRLPRNVRVRRKPDMANPTRRQARRHRPDAASASAAG